MSERGNGFTDRQRRAILERDNYQGQMRHYDEVQGWHTGGYCPEWQSCDSVHVHHITPQRVANINGWSREDINDPDNLITLYSCEHTGQCPRRYPIDPYNHFVVHPDVIEAMHEYPMLKGQAFENMGAKRDELLSQGIAYWNTDHDAEMYETAVERTILAESQGWHYPLLWE